MPPKGTKAVTVIVAKYAIKVMIICVSFGTDSDAVIVMIIVFIMVYCGNTI